jgi:glycosyltransferase involved in cell wall biosynthesis
MQERKKKKIVIASVLKPVDETRMYGKMATSLANVGHEVHVYGNTGSGAQPNGNIFLHEHVLRGRLSLKRLLVAWQLLRKWLVVKPDVLIVCSHELLIAALVYKSLRPVKLLYDVQENYYLNILHTKAFPVFIRWLLAGYVRLKEKVSALFFDHFFLAESVYIEQLNFIKSAYSIIPNTVPKPKLARLKLHGYSQWLFSGTLAETTGVYKVIELVKALHSVDTSIRLTICGFAPSNSEQRRIRMLCNDLDYISLIGIEDPVSHKEIVEAIQQANIGFIYYPPAAHTAGRIPTKFYEYSSLDLSILTLENQAIANMVIDFGLGWVLAEKQDTARILAQIKQLPSKKSLPADHFWEFTEKQLFRLIDSL